MAPASMPKPLPGGVRVGITIGLFHANESLWTNGIKQNAIFLAEALRHCPSVQSVALVNMTAIPITSALPWDQQRWPTLTFEQAKDQVDLLVELGGQAGPEQTEYLKQRGVRLVSYCCGVEYVNAMESILFGKPLFGHNLFVNRRYDDIWMVPQVAHISEPYFSTLRRRPARAVPFIWDPVFLTALSEPYPHHGEYRPKPGPRRLSVMEPNINVVKFCLYPILIAEEAFRQRPELVSFLHVTNSEQLATHSAEFQALMLQLDIVQQHKAAFVGRFDTARFLSEFTDVMISHQWENPLNYFYLEVCWQGYPLVHNAHLCADLGYYYTGNDVKQGAATLLQVMTDHDARSEEYTSRQRSLISRYLPGNPALTAAYDELLVRLMAQPLA